MVSWADRVAYVCHDWEDAVLTGIVSPHQLPDIVRDRVRGTAQARNSARSSDGLVSATLRSGQVGMDEEMAEALSAFRSCNYERIYLRDASLRQGRSRWCGCCGHWSSTSPTAPT